MKEFKIEVPEGMEIDKENSTFECIRFKDKGVRFPDSVKEIEGRYWYIGGDSSILEHQGAAKDINQLSSCSRARAFLALMQLVELRDYVNDGWVPDWECSKTKKHCIVYQQSDSKVLLWYNTSHTLFFKSIETAEKFLNKYKSLIETAKELI